MFSLRSASRAKSIIMMAFFFTMPIKQQNADQSHHVQLVARQRSAPSRAPTPAEGSVERIVIGCM